MMVERTVRGGRETAADILLGDLRGTKRLIVDLRGRLKALEGRSDRASLVEQKVALLDLEAAVENRKSLEAIIARRKAADGVK